MKRTTLLVFLVLALASCSEHGLMTTPSADAVHAAATAPVAPTSSSGSRPAPDPAPEPPSGTSGESNPPSAPPPIPTASVAAACGNGTVESGEQCDDGNLIDWDGCQANCTWTPTCDEFWHELPCPPPHSAVCNIIGAPDVAVGPNAVAIRQGDIRLPFSGVPGRAPATLNFTIGFPKYVARGDKDFTFQFGAGGSYPYGPPQLLHGEGCRMDTGKVFFVTVPAK